MVVRPSALQRGGDKNAPQATFGAHLCAVRICFSRLLREKQYSYPAQLSVKGVCQGGSPVPLDRVLPTFARTKVGPRRVGVLTKPCKRPRDADRRLQIWSKISFTAFHGRKAGPAGRRILLCGEGRAQAGEGDLREVVAGLAGRAIQVHAVNGDLLPAGQGAKGGAALQVIQKG